MHCYSVDECKCVVCVCVCVRACLSVCVCVRVHVRARVLERCLINSTSGPSLGPLAHLTKLPHHSLAGYSFGKLRIPTMQLLLRLLLTPEQLVV